MMSFDSVICNQKQIGLLQFLFNRYTFVLYLLLEICKMIQEKWSRKCLGNEKGKKDLKIALTKDEC